MHIENHLLSLSRVFPLIHKHQAVPACAACIQTPVCQHMSCLRVLFGCHQAPRLPCQIQRRTMCQAGFHMLVLESGSALITVYGPLSSSSHTTVNKTHHAEAESPASASPLIFFFYCSIIFSVSLLFVISQERLCRNIMRKFCGRTHDGIGCY